MVLPVCMVINVVPITKVKKDINKYLKTVSRQLFYSETHEVSEE
jgi:hypothetical protein